MTSGVAMAAATLATTGCSTAPAAPARTKKAAVRIVPEPAALPTREGMVDVGGAKLWYWDTGGHGEVVLLSHPATGSATSWPYQQVAFAQAGYRVIGYSRRGFYKSEAGPADARVPASKDLAALVDGLGIDRFHLVGSAAGAMVAADYTVSYPKRLKSVVLGSSVLGVRDPLLTAANAALIPTNFNTMPPEFRELGPSYRATNPAGVKRWVEIEQQSHNGVRAAGGAAIMANPPSFEQLAATRVPMLLLTGDCDLYMPIALLEMVAQRLPAAEVAYIDDAGHAAFWEQPETYNAIVLKFLRQHRG